MSDTTASSLRQWRQIDWHKEMYKLDNDGLHIPTKQIEHRNDEYDERGFNTLLDMQSKHFWYIGRHRFILEILKRYEKKTNFSAVDLGGGCGGWVN